MKHFLKMGLAAFAMASLGLAAQASDKKDFVVGYSQYNGTNKFLIAQAEGARKAIEEWKAKGVNIELLVTNAGDSDINRQVADLEDLYTRGVDGVLVFPADSKVIAQPIVNVYNANDIPVVVTDVGIERGDYVHFNSSDNYKAGEIAAELLAERVAKGGKVIAFNHLPGNRATQDRGKGFADKAAELGLVVLPEKLYTLSLENGRRLAEDTLTAIPDIAGIFTFNSIGAQGAYSAIEAASRTNDVVVVSTDIDPVGYQMAKDGKISALIVQDPFRMGYEGLNNLVYKLTGDDAKIVKELKIPLRILTKDNADEFADDPQVSTAK